MRGQSRLGLPSLLPHHAESSLLLKHRLALALPFGHRLTKRSSGARLSADLSQLSHPRL